MSTLMRVSFAPPRLRLRLRTFLVLCVASGACLGLVAPQVVTIARTCQAVRKLEQQGVIVGSDFYSRYGLFPWQRRGALGAVLEWSLAAPNDVLAFAVTSNDSQTLMQSLATLPSLRRVDLTRTSISSSDLKSLSHADQLEELYLAATPIDDSALAVLSKLDDLKLLDLSDTRVSDDAITLIAGMSSLKSVNLANTQVSKSALRNLRRIRPDLAVSPEAPRRPREPSRNRERAAKRMKQHAATS